ncbi:TOMM precursor leader peptide-binding protein [Nocardiopsis sp. NPDC049922]|uniref:TOMM precursor leader peptide-binding protein n=1 Tax=Nocardiopsis sp. NPDC049922 TaxID=3155157 RepID=UPI0033C63950
MAAALRLTDTAVAAVGDFGRAVQRRLVDAGAVPVDPEHVEHVEPRPTVLVTWRPEPELGEAFDRISRDRGTPWLPVAVDHPRLVVGPWLDPSDGPCHRCYLGRRSQHDSRSDVRARVLDAYANDDTLGVLGYLPHHVRTAEALVRRELGAPRAGRVAMVDLFGARPAFARVAARHGCERCGADDRWGGALPLAELAARVRPGRIAEVAAR